MGLLKGWARVVEGKAASFLMSDQLPTHLSAVLTSVSVLVAIVAAYLALDLVQRSAGRPLPRRRLLVGAGGLTMGLGIWSMHFIGMEALHMGMAMSYEPLLVALSLLAAVLGSGVALAVVALRRPSRRALLSAATFMALAIASMHYLGMASMEMEAHITWNAWLVIASLAVAWVASLLALWLVVQIGSQRLRLGFGRRSLAAVVLGLGVSGMHYTAMAGASFHEVMDAMSHGSVSSDALTIPLAIGAALMLAILLGGAAADQRSAMTALAFAKVSDLSRRLSRSDEPRLEACLALRELAGADLVVLVESGEDRGLRPSAATDAELELDGLAEDPALLDALRRSAVAAVGSTPAQGALARAGFGSARFEPLVMRGRARGIFVLAWRRSGRRGSVEQTTSMLATLAAEAGMAIDRQDLLTRLDFLARRDELTGLLNRRVLQEELDRAVETAHRDDTPLSLAMLDLDSFKDVNDSQGHQAGDRLLKSAAAAWTGALREGGVLARFGGDEFAAVLPGAGVETAAAVAERLRAATPKPVGCSVGVATLEPGQSAAELLGEVDDRLYAAKRAGRDRVVAVGEAGIGLATRGPVGLADARPGSTVQ
jgi:diguanylate cyclase (GGDEF)-like protein